MKDYDKCKNCLGECPENCNSCIYQYCKKQVDFALVEHKYNKWINKYLETENENKEWAKFEKWFLKYFNIQ